MVIRIKRNSNVNFCGFLELCASVALVMSPVLQHYKGFIFNAGWSVLILGIPFILALALFKGSSLKLNSRSLTALSIIILYYLWHVADHGFSYGDVIKVLVLLVYYLAIVTDMLNVRTIIKIAAVFALINVVCLIAQYVSFYVIGKKLQFINTARMVNEDNRWMNRLTSTSVLDIFYRPSALFLEPSHLFLFFFPVVLFLLFDEQTGRKSHILGFVLTGGIFLSTSGMGVLFSVVAIFVYLAMFRKTKFGEGKLANLFSFKTLSILIAAALVLVVLITQVEVVNRTFVRIFATDYKGYNAIAGRTTSGRALLADLTTRERIIGVADAMGDLGTTVSGFQAEFWRHGLIGIALSYSYYLYCLLVQKQKVYMFTVVTLLCLSFFCGHTHREFFMLYFSSYMLSGLVTKSDRSENRIILRRGKNERYD